MEDHTIWITEKDLLRINNLLDSAQDDFENLELELDRAKVVEDGAIPKDVVTMNSTFEFETLQDGKTMQATLVYPNEADFDKGKISVLAPLGSALLGLKVGQSINWMFPDGKTKTLKIIRMVYQPEASEDWHL